VLNQQRVADVLQDGAPSAWRLPLLGKLARQRLDPLDDRGNLALIARKDDTLGQRVGNDHDVLGRDGPQENWTARQDLFIAIGCSLNRRSFIFADR